MTLGAPIWRPSEALTVPIGVTDAGDVLTLGLRRDGPHGLVAGTTASGKSELLQTILAGLAATHPPEQVGFVLIDYKGGAAFSDMARLPHALGVVTDLDGRLAARALVSLNSELRRRERLLRAADVPSISEYERSGAGEVHPLPNLVIVVDELATLVQEVPGFVDALVDVAQRGRSLGVHLLLATQSPGGVVGPKVQANLNVWICLRVTLPSESQAMIGSDLASAIPVNAPGRGYIRVGTRVTGFQAVRVTRAARSAGEASLVRVGPFLDRSPRRSRPPADPPGVPGAPAAPTEARVLVDRLVAEAARLGARTFPGPWTPPLPERLLRADLAHRGAPSSEHLCALLGLSDEPELQRQAPCWLDLSSDGACVAFGVFGAGKSTLLKQIALDLALRREPRELHVYGFDAGDGSLSPVGRLPHCSAVVGVGDTERTVRATGRLCRMLEERRGLLAASGLSDWARLRSARPDAGPWVVLLFDDYPSFAELAEGDRHGVLAGRFAALLRNGPQVGIHPVVSTQRRTDLPSSLFGLFGRRVLLRQAEAADYDLAGVPRDVQPASLPPGRAWVTGAPAREIQICLPCPPGDPYPPPGCDPVPGSDGAVADAGLPRPVPAFPTQVDLREVLSAGGTGPRRRTGPTPHRLPARGSPGKARRRTAGGGTIVLGLGGPELEPVSADLERNGPHLLIGGAERLGRSTALLTCMRSVAAHDPDARFVVLAPRPSPLRSVGTGARVLRVAVGPDDIAEAVAWMDAEPAPIVLVADDCEALPQEASPSLSRVLRRARETGVHGLFAGRPADLCRLYEDWVRFLRSQRSGILLAPDAADADLFDLRLPAFPVPRLPGRGYLVAGHDLVPLQVALAASGPPRPAVPSSP
jgi:S-DNA-T family DNA segregation ATPase FtsK/SpoIIIE